MNAQKWYERLAQKWGWGELEMSDIRQLIDLVREETYDDAASIAINFTNDKERGDYDTFSAASAISHEIRAKRNEVGDYHA